jgi:hypothetical protein
VALIVVLSFYLLRLGGEALAETEPAVSWVYGLPIVLSFFGSLLFFLSIGKYPRRLGGLQERSP